MDKEKASSNQLAKKSKRKVIVIVLSTMVLLAVLWCLVSSKGFRSAFANNRWSLNFVEESRNSNFSYEDLLTPPARQADAGLWLAHQALKEGDEEKALLLLNDLAEAGDELALDTQAKIFFNQKRYEEALDNWISTKNSRSLEVARGQFIELELPELQYRADKALYEIRPEEYATWYAYSLNDNGEFEAGLELLEDSIQKYPSSDQKSTWYRLIGDFYRDQKDWVNAEIYYQQALSTSPVDAKAEANLEGLYKLKKNESNGDGN
ncbi:MAG: hypothetical protein KBA03_05740 [Anaerolineaceae bacterium]|nr:hypothetical protein [Anaerolineaceae bacterium]